MTKWEVIISTYNPDTGRRRHETRTITADNWGVTDGTFTAFYNQPGTKKTRDPFHYIKTADIHEIKRLDEPELTDEEWTLWREQADTPPVQP